MINKNNKQISNEMDEHSGRVTVEKAKQLRLGPNIYPMIGQVRGYCLIIDNYKFENCSERFGSKRDANRLHQVFSQLNFCLIHEKNLTANQINDLLDFTSRRPELESHNALVIIILTHGSHGVIYGSDFTERDERVTGILNVRQLIDKFNDKNCVQLQGKPKIFFMSCCRGGRSTKFFFSQFIKVYNLFVL
jgi:hypothetical protein